MAFSVINSTLAMSFSQQKNDIFFFSCLYIIYIVRARSLLTTLYGVSNTISVFFFLIFQYTKDAMKLNLTPEIVDYLNALIDQKNLNRAASELLNDYLNNHYDDIDDELLNLSGKKEQGEKTAFKNAFFSLLDEDEGEYKERIDSCNIGSFDLLDEKEYKNNPYYQHVSFRPKRIKDYRLTYNHFSPYEAFVYDERKDDEKKDYSEITPVGYFHNEFTYPVLRKGDVIWMSIIPHEINTRKKAIEEADGDIITFGLGLGYYAYRTSIKENVNKVTVVEKDKDIIALFNSELLPSFPKKEKIEIVKDDCFAYLKKMKNCPSLVFVDIYHQAEDALPVYLKRKPREKAHPGVKFLYWIEKDIITLLRRYVLTILEEASIGYTLKDYENPSNEEERILLTLRKKREPRDFEKKEQLQKLLSEKGLKELASL